MTIPSAGEDVNQYELSSIAGRKANGTAMLEDSSADAYEVKQILPYSPVITLFGIYPFELKHMFTQKIAHKCL